MIVFARTQLTSAPDILAADLSDNDHQTNTVGNQDGNLLFHRVNMTDRAQVSSDNGRDHWQAPTANLPQINCVRFAP